MTKEFCDRCGELIPEGKGMKHIGCRLENAANKYDPWLVEAHLNRECNRHFHLCHYCFFELLEQAHTCWCEARDKDLPIPERERRYLRKPKEDPE